MECFEANNTVYYTMECLDGGSLDELINKKQGLPEAEVIKYIWQIAEAMSYMHKHNVLKNENKTTVKTQRSNILMLRYSIA